jgi:hypothetical protein
MSVSFGEFREHSEYLPGVRTGQSAFRQKRRGNEHLPGLRGDYHRHDLRWLRHRNRTVPRRPMHPMRPPDRLNTLLRPTAPPDLSLKHLSSVLAEAQRPESIYGGPSSMTTAWSAASPGPG